MSGGGSRCSPGQLGLGCGSGVAVTRTRAGLSGPGYCGQPAATDGILRRPAASGGDAAAAAASCPPRAVIYFPVVCGGCLAARGVGGGERGAGLAGRASAEAEIGGRVRSGPSSLGRGPRGRHPRALPVKGVSRLCEKPLQRRFAGAFCKSQTRARLRAFGASKQAAHRARSAAGPAAWVAAGRLCGAGCRGAPESLTD